MTHASDLAKLAETFIDRYLVECDARREAEAALAKSEEERATQSANLAAAMAECERLKADHLMLRTRAAEAALDPVAAILLGRDRRDDDDSTERIALDVMARIETLKAARAEMDRREKQDAWDAGYIRGRDTVVESDRERERLTDEIASLREANIGLGAEAGKLKARIADLKADLDAVAGSLGVESTREAILRTIERVRADIKRKDREWSEMRNERDALRRAEAGKGAGDATDEIRDVHGRRAYELSGNPIRWDALSEETRDDWCRSVRRLLDNMEIGPHGALVASTAERGAIGALVKERDSWRAKAEAAEARDSDLRTKLKDATESGTLTTIELVAQAKKWRVLARACANETGEEIRRRAEDVKAWQSATGCATPDEAKAAGEGRVVGEPAWRKDGNDETADMGDRIRLRVGRYHGGAAWWQVVITNSHLDRIDEKGDAAGPAEAKRAAVSFALSLNGATLAKTHAHLAERDRCFGCGDSSPAVRCSLCATCAEAVTGRTLAQPRASMLTAMAEVGMLVGLDVPQDKTDREVWNVFGNRVREEVKARLAAGADADRRAREALDRVVGAYAKGRADAMRTFAQPADAEWLAMSSLVQDGWRVLVERHRDNTQTGPTPEVAAAFSEHVAYPHAPCYVAQPADAEGGHRLVGTEKCAACKGHAGGHTCEVVPTSPAKPAGRYVAVRADEVRGRPCFYTKTEGAARDGARSCNRDLSSFDPDDSVSDMPDIYPWAVVDTATAPQPSPRAAGVDAERLAVAFDNALRMIAGSASAMATAMNRPNMTEAMRRALATIGAQPVVALTIDALHTARVAAVRDAGGIEAHMSTERMFRHLTASGPVAIPAGIDREALIAARTCVMAHGGPGMSRMVQAIDGVIRAGDAGKADAVTVEEIVNAFDDEVDNQPRTTISEDLRTVLTANVGKVIAGAGKP